MTGESLLIIALAAALPLSAAGVFIGIGIRARKRLDRHFGA
jgi:hypothetical protein